MLEFVKVEQPEQIAVVADLAARIWRQHFTPIIGPAQVEYMLAKFQSAPAIAAQLAQGYAYFLAQVAGTPVGYLALVRTAPAELQLSKLYLLDSVRGQGFGREMVTFALAQGRAAGAAVLWLTCNRHNAASLAFYDRLGCRRAGTLVADIGGGYIMDDYRLELPIPPNPG